MKIKPKPQNTGQQSTINNQQLSRVMIAGTHSGVGKTTITLGVMSILSKMGFKVQGFKSGPDYIDVSHHTAVTGNKSRNLDTWMMSDNSCRELFHRTAVKADISIIEGVMGLYDGSLNDGEKGSSAYLAKVLNAPIILVIDVKGMAQSAGAIALGFQNYDKNVQIKGIILNRVGSEKHFNTIRTIIESTAKIPVLGYLPRNDDFVIEERHLGLVPYGEDNVVNNVYGEIGKHLKDTLDIDKIIEVAVQANDFPAFEKILFPNSQSSIVNNQSPIRLAVALDKAFHFYYRDNLELLEALGADLCYFSPLQDEKLPDDIDGIYIGGGFPELYGNDLEANKNMRCAINAAAKEGVLIYAECGGMMYLLDKLVDCDGHSYLMCGVLHAASAMTKKRQGLGYINIEAHADNIMCRKGDTFKAHEFHWSSLIETNNNENIAFAYKVTKGYNSKVKFDGLISCNILASYAHVHFASNPQLAVNLMNAMR
ncbi:MAG: cobyrinate a,c-diamide synthase [Candidatus Anammoxibacter sp.]